MNLNYGEYYDKVLGGWIGKSVGGTVGARFEGDKRWIEITYEEAFPKEVPPNDDLDLQVLWLKVLEEKGAALTCDDLAQAWLDHCWYPFCEYGNFRRNCRLGIHPPRSGLFNNEFYATGMGCPIRSEIWGYVFPGAPALAAAYAEQDGALDHGIDAISAEQFFSAMAAMAFFTADIRALIDENLHYLPEGTQMRRMVRAAIDAHAEGLDLKEARARLLLLRGHPEPCDSLLNVPFTILGLLYGHGDMGQTLFNCLRCGYDTDCTLATAAAFLGQILGAKRIPAHWKDPIGDKLVMGIEYRRPEMTLSALARDTARVGTLLTRQLNPSLAISDAPDLKPLPRVKPPAATLRVEYLDEPVAAPGDTVRARLVVEFARVPSADCTLCLTPPETFTAQPARVVVPALGGRIQSFAFDLRAREDAREFPMKNLFRARLTQGGRKTAEREFGVMGAGLWRVLGAYFDPQPPDERNDGKTAIDRARQCARKSGRPWRPWVHYYVALDRDYINEAKPDVDALFRQWSRLLGRPAVLAQRSLRLEPHRIIGVQAEYCLYLYQELICPEARTVNLVMGNNDGYRVYVNGKRVAEADEQLWWTPRQAIVPVQLRKGLNRVLLKLLRRNTVLEFSFGVRDHLKAMHFNRLDWTVDLATINPLAT